MPTETGFESLDSNQTGLRFDNPLVLDHPLACLYAGSFQTGGVAIGDVDGDGHPDVFLTGGPRANRLFRQVDAWRFEDITEKAGLETAPVWSSGAALVDIDGDTDLDIYVCNYNVPNLLYINQGDGTFREEAQQRGLAIADASHTPAFCDYDNDGDLDVYVLTNRLTHPNGRLPEMIEVDPRTGRASVKPRFGRFTASASKASVRRRWTMSAAAIC